MQLSYLDNKAISDSEKRFSEAFVKGGAKLEEEERRLYAFEQERNASKDRAQLKDYYHKIDERMKRTVVQMKIETAQNKLKLMQRKEELTKSIGLLTSYRTGK